jgi:Phosphoesterase family
MTIQPGKRAFDHVLVIMFENQYRAYVMANPYMRKLALQGIDLRASFGVMHPSQTNYIATIAGELCNVTSDGAISPLLGQRTIVDLIEEAPGELRWKAYMQSYLPHAQPWTPDLVPVDAKPYYVKHNPFASFAGIVRDQARWRRIVDEAELFADVLNGELPELAWFTPNIWNDGHYTDGTYEAPEPRAPALTDQLARWLEGFFARLRFPGPRSHLPPRTLVVVTFDESDFEAAWDAGNASAYDGPNQIYTVLLGDMITPGVEDEGYNHYSLLKTIEINFGLGSLGKNDAEANWYQFLWDRRFAWGAALRTPIDDARALAAEHFAGALHVVAADAAGALQAWTLADGRWSSARALAGEARQLGLAASAGELVMVALAGEGQLRASRYDMQAGWTALAGPINQAPATALAIHAMGDGQRIMLVWQSEGGSLHSRIWAAGAFGDETVLAGHVSHGPIALGRLGASLYLFARLDPRGDALSMISYNTAAFNVVSVPTNKYGGAQDNTTVDAWSPSAFPVAHFSARPDARTPGELEPASQPYAARGSITCATLDGVLHVIHRGIDDDALRSETLSIAGLMTPAQPVSYKSTDSATSSDGFGTAIEAGFARQQPIHAAMCAAEGVLASARSHDELVMLFQPVPAGPVSICSGRYRRAD